MTERSSLAVALAGREYDIVIESGLLASGSDELARRFGGRPARIVTDEIVSGLHLAAATRMLRDAGLAVGEPTVVPPGEGSKSFETFAAVCEDILASGIDRSTVIVALGGGVVGDLTGFAAASMLRGLDFVQIPTTLLAQVDSSVGGKTSVNSRAGKNLVGAFHQPRLVLIDTDTLDTLPRREMLCGYAEIVKHALIVDRAFFDRLEQSAVRMLDGGKEERAAIIHRSCAIKAEIVTRDEFEHGDRALLNFGHTFGHALEALTGMDDTLKHGEAVAIGTIMALDLSVRLGLCPEADRVRVLQHYRAVGLPTAVDPAWKITTAGMLDSMRKDKKNAGDRIGLILSRGIGSSFVSHDVPMDILHATLNKALGETYSFA